MRIIAYVTAVFVVFTATIIVLAFGTLNVAQGQAGGGGGGGNITLTPAQKAAMCDPNNPSLKFVNTTESHICGIPKSPSPNSTATSQLPTPTTPSVPASPTAP
jgi:hypothetical protein